MASVTFTNARLSDLSPEQIALMKEEVCIKVGVAGINQSSEKTHAIAEVIFDKSYKKARLSFTRDQIQYGWPSRITNSSSPNPISTNATSGTYTFWSEMSVHGEMMSHFIANSHLFREYMDKCLLSVQQVTLTFNSEKTYENSLLKITAVTACKGLFPNLKSYSLVFSSL